MSDCVTRGPQRVDWDAHAGRDPNALLYAAGTLAGGLAQPDCAQHAFATLLRTDTASDAANRQWAAVAGQHALLLARGDTAGAMAAIEAVIARYGFGDSLFLLGAPIVERFMVRADSMAKTEAIEYGEDYNAMPYNTRLWETGLVQAKLGHAAIAEGIAEELRRRAGESGSARDSLMAVSVMAGAAIARGDRDTAETLLRDLMNAPFDADELKWDEATPRGLERLEYARLLGERGEWRRAIEVASVFDSSWPVFYPLYVPASLELRERAATALGDDDLAGQFQRRLANTRSIDR
jgi:hypothetical protein